jgi:hypothetical protein
MMKNKKLKIIAIISIIAMLSIIVIPKTSFGLISQSAVPWFWGSDTNAASVATGDVNGDGQNEIVTTGYYNDGTHWVAQLHIWNATNLSVENVMTWIWGSNTQSICVAVGNITGGKGLDIVTGGAFFDGTRWVAQLHMWNGTTLAVEKAIVWYWAGNTHISSIAIGDVNGDGQQEIVTAGTYFDGTRTVALLHVWNANFAVLAYQPYFWAANTYIDSVAVGNITGNKGLEIVTGGEYFDGTRYVAQLHVWNGTTLAVEKVITWFWGSNTYVNTIAIANISGTSGTLSIITGGTYFDGTRDVAQLMIWNASTPTLSVQNFATWFTTSTTKINSVAVGNVTGSASLDIITGGSFNDGVRTNAQIIEFSGANLAVKSSANWYVASDTAVNSVAVGIFAALGNRIVATGTFNDGTRANAQLTVWT